MNKGLILFTVVWIFVIVIVFLLRKHMENKLVSNLINKEFEHFDKRVNAILYKLLIPPFNVFSIKLNSYYLREDTDKISEMMNNLDESRLNIKQKTYIWSQVFNYFVNKRKRTEAKLYLDKISKLNDRKFVSISKWTYDTMIENGYAYIIEALDALNTMTGLDKVKTLMLIAMMYANKGDEENCTKYKHLAEKEAEVYIQ